MATEGPDYLLGLYKIPELLKCYYDICDTVDIKQLDSRLFLIEQANFKSVMKFHDPMNLCNYEKLNHVYESCSRSNLSPKMIRNKDGNVLSLHGELLFSLHEYLYVDKLSPDIEKLIPKRIATLHKYLNSLDLGNVNNHLDKTVTNLTEAMQIYSFSELLPIIEMVMKKKERYSLQLLHGDLHSNNIICRGGNVYFIDFDSLTSSVAVSEVAFAAFRVTDGDPERMLNFVAGYNESNPLCEILVDDIWPFLVYNVLQRIIFIYIQNDRGDSRWINDLPKQKRFLELGLQHVLY